MRGMILEIQDPATLFREFGMKNQRTNRKHTLDHCFTDMATFVRGGSLLPEHEARYYC